MAELLTHHTSNNPNQAALSIDPTNPADPINPRLYGKFCEHLGSNIYNGMDAQILRNPTFAAWPFGGPRTPDGGVGQTFDREQVARQIAKIADKLDLPNAEAMTEAYQAACAMFWFGVGDGERLRFSPDLGEHRCRAQRLEVLSAGEPAGVGQLTYLPLHREHRYPFRVAGRAARPCSMTLAIAACDAAGQAGETLAEATIELGYDHTVCTGELTLPSGVDADALYQVSLTSVEPVNVVLQSVQLQPADHVNGADPDVIARFREAKLPLLRWPGGNFSSGYHWRDGVGPIDLRPTRRNFAWATLESHLFGTDEFIALCRAVGCEPMICVNGGNGTPDEAAAWIEYCNGSIDTPMGALRAEHGHPEPYDVKIWEVGNELYGKWQVNWSTPGGYVDRYARFAKAMLKADPSIQLVANGHHARSEWDETLIATHGKTMGWISGHALTGGQVDETVDPAELLHAFMAYPQRVTEGYVHNVNAIREAGNPDPGVAVTELQLFAHYKGNTEDSGSPSRAPIATPSTISEALYASVFIHCLARAGQGIRMLTHSATVNHGGGLRKQHERVRADPVHYAHVMGVEMAGMRPVPVNLTSGVMSTAGPTGNLEPVKDLPTVDALAAMGDDGKSLRIMLVHRCATVGPIELAMDLSGLGVTGEATVTTLTGDHLADENTLTDPDRLRPHESKQAIESDQLALALPPLSLVRVDLELG